MSDRFSLHQQHTGTYNAQGRGSTEELHSLQKRDQMITASIGGVLPEQADPIVFQQVLDIGCGTGDWLIETARTYPTISLLVGIDISERMVTYAHAQATALGVSDRVQFRVMDAMRVLEFPPDSFDLVNQRLGSSYLRTWDWSNILSEFQRITAPGGVIRITDTASMESSSPALNHLTDLLQRASYQSGHSSSPDGNTIVSEVIHLLQRLEIQNIQARSNTLEYRSGTPEWQFFYEDMKHALRMFQSFVLKWLRVVDYEKLCQQALDEMQQPDFVGTWKLLTIWGSKLQ